MNVSGMPLADPVTGPLQPDVRVLSARRLRLDRSWRGTNGRMWFWRWWRNDRSGGSIRWRQGTWRPVRPGRDYLIPAGHRFAWRCDRDTDGQHVGIHFEINPAAGNRLAGLCTQPVSLPGDQIGSDLCQHLDTDGMDSVQTLFAGAIIRVALGQLLSQLPAAQRQRLDAQARKRARLAPALDHVRSHFSAQQTVADLAARCGMGADRFARLFRECIGEPPARHLLHIRLAAAARALVMSDARIDDIAEDCGFSDRFHLSRHFVRHYGDPPARYRHLAACG